MKYLDELKIDYEEQKTFDDLKNKNNLFFDFYIPEKKIVFEIDGPHHREQNHFFNQEKFDYRQKCDNIKNEYCEKNNIIMVRIEHINDIKKAIDKALF